MIFKLKKTSKKKLSFAFITILFLLILGKRNISARGDFSKSSSPEVEASPAVVNTDNLPAEIWGAWVEQDYLAENTERFGFSAKYNSAIRPPEYYGYEGYETMAADKKADFQADYIAEILNGFIPVFWTDFDTFRFNNPIGDPTQCPPPWPGYESSVYPYDENLPTTFHLTQTFTNNYGNEEVRHLWNYYTMLYLLTQPEMRAQEELIRGRLRHTIGRREYKTRIQEINSIIRYGYKGRVIFLNEPDLSNQACRTPKQAAEILVKAKSILPYAQFIGPNSTLSHNDSYINEFFHQWFDVMGRRDMPLAGVGFHLYGNYSMNVTVMIDSLRVVLDRYKNHFAGAMTPSSPTIPFADDNPVYVLPLYNTEAGVHKSSNFCWGEETYKRFSQMRADAVRGHYRYPLIAISPYTHYVLPSNSWQYNIAMTRLNDNGDFYVTHYGEAIIAALNDSPPDLERWCGNTRRR